MTSTAREILVVDDTPASAYLLGKLLESLGNKVRSVSNGEAAISAVMEQRPDLVISDLSMPGMDGFELAQRLRGLPEGDAMVIAALSGLARDSDQERATQAGFNHFLVKPVSIDALRALVASVPDGNAS